MVSPAEREIRRLVSEGLETLNRENGGRYRFAIARRVEVDRTTVGRWLRQESTPTFENCEVLAKAYPSFFNWKELVELLQKSATPFVLDEPLTVGASLHSSTLAVYEEATRALEREPDKAEDRVCLHCVFHLDRRGSSPTSSDPFLGKGEAKAMRAFQGAMIKRAGEGWKMRHVNATNSVRRFDSIERMVSKLDGPNVEIRAYPTSLPLSIAPLIVGNRDVFFAYDNRRWERPKAALVLRAWSIVNWATDYFESLFSEAPYTLRDVHGPVVSELERFRLQLEEADDIARRTRPSP